MARKIKLSAQATEYLDRARITLEMRNRDKYEPLRIAFARSLQKESQLKHTTPDKKGFEIEVPTLEQNDGLLFRLVLQQLYQRHLTDEEYEDYLKLHLEDGLKIINAETDKTNGYEYLLLLADKGGRDGGLSNQSKNYISTLASNVTEFNGIIKLNLGVIQQLNNQAYHINFNKTSEHSNNHVAIIGKPGSGKTTFIKHFITEIRKKSNFQTQFVMFDYKGDLWNDEKFHSDTKTEVLKVKEQPIPLNMFKLEENTEQERKRQAERFVQIVRDVEANIGKIQEQKLYDAVLAAYSRAQSGGFGYPDFTDIRAELERMDKKPDSLTSVFRPLTEQNLFATKAEPLWDSPLNRSVIVDIHALLTQKELCVFFILKELQKHIMLLPDSSVHPETFARTMRTVIVIDEAHHFLKDKKRAAILAEMIREVRSKGVAVILLSQSPDDFDQADFDFLEMLEFVYVLNCNASSHKFLERVFGIPTQEARNLRQEVSALPVGTAFTKTAQGLEKIILPN